MLHISSLLFLLGAPGGTESVQLQGPSSMGAPLALAWGESAYVQKPRVSRWAPLGGSSGSVAFVSPSLRGLRSPPHSTAGSATEPAAGTAAAKTPAASTIKDALFPFGAPPPLSPESAGDSRTAAALDEAKAVVEKEMWRLYELQQKHREPQQKLLSKEQMEQLAGFSRDFCNSAKASGKLTANECVATLM